MKGCFCDRCDRPLRHYSEPWVQYLNRIPQEWRDAIVKQPKEAFEYSRGYPKGDKCLCGRCCNSQSSVRIRNEKRALLRRKVQQMRRRK